MPLLVYAAASLVLLGFGLATMGIGLVIVLPLWAASSYAAWKDVFGVRPHRPPAAVALTDARGSRRRQRAEADARLGHRFLR